MDEFDIPTPETMHRGAKLFMDRGEAATYADAIGILQTFRISILVGDDVALSEGAQVALLTAVNTAQRSFLGGVDVVNCPEAPTATFLVKPRALRQAVRELGGRLCQEVDPTCPVLLLGDVDAPSDAKTVLRVTWQGWSGGVTTASSGIRLGETGNMHVAPILAASIAVGEAFQFLAGRSPYAGCRNAGLSLWSPTSSWTDPDAAGASLTWLPSQLWLIGLGNLGQAFLWCLGALPYASPEEVRLTLQDDDTLQTANESTSILSHPDLTGQLKTRAMAVWAERHGFMTRLEERRFGPWTKRSDQADDPMVAFCGVDNAEARTSLEEAGFLFILEAGLGAGPNAYRDWAMHCFPGGRRAGDIWGMAAGQSAAEDPSNLPAYQAAGEAGLDPCGILQLASRTVGVPFVGLTAAAVAVGELLRRMHGGARFDAIAGTMASLEDTEFVDAQDGEPWLYGSAEVG